MARGVQFYRGTRRKRRRIPAPTANINTQNTQEQNFPSDSLANSIKKEDIYSKPDVKQILVDGNPISNRPASPVTNTENKSTSVNDSECDREECQNIESDNELQQQSTVQNEQEGSESNQIETNSRNYNEPPADPPKPRSFVKYRLPNGMFRCHVEGCGKEFSNGSKFGEHQNIHSARFQCCLCLKCFPSKANLIIHERIHTGQRPFECTKCDARFIRSTDLKSHLLSVHNYERQANTEHQLSTELKGNESDSNENDNSSEDNDSPVPQAKRSFLKYRLPNGMYRCPVDGCNMEFGGISHFGAHQNKHSARFQCSACLKCLGTKTALLVHERMHTGERPFACTECDARFTQNVALNVHYRNQHTDERRFACDECEKRFKNKTGLDAHKLVHTGERPFACEQCDARFRQRFVLTDHKRRIHTSERPFVCDQCSKRFPTKEELNRHLRVHTREQRYRCEQCPRKFAGRYQLIIHQRTHTGERPFHCEHCDKRFRSNITLKLHILIHTGEKPYVCKQCDKRFTTPANLASHKLVHTNIQPHHCPQCPKRFRTAYQLKDHLLTHSGEKSFICDQCDRRFSRAILLAQHIRCHTGERPYACNECDQRFVSKSSFHYHRGVQCTLCMPARSCESFFNNFSNF